MRNLCDEIENYIKLVLASAGGTSVEIQRNALADRFGCSPSQINYVLATRFGPDRGYVVESRRGGRGFIRITVVPLDSDGAMDELLAAMEGQSLSQDQAEDIIVRLVEAGIIKVREAAIMRAAIDRRTLAVPLPARDEIRGRMMQAMVAACLRHTKDESIEEG